MSDATEDTSSRSQTSQGKRKVKFTRLRRSCDECRRKKIACDSAKLPGNVCTHCQRFKVQCTHYLSCLPTKSQTQKEYILKLETRIGKLESYIKRIHPGEDVDHLINMSSAQDPPSSFEFANLKCSESIAPPMSSDVVSSTSREEAHSDSEGDDLAHVALSEHFSHLSLHLVEDRFFGQASAFMLAKQVSTLRHEIAGVPNPTQDLNKHKRPLFWDLKPWELAFCLSLETLYVYPDDDLLMSLVSLFFEKTNCLVPVLHQPTFMKSLSLGQHHWDAAFGMTVLMVCAIGSRYSQDPRVFVANDASGLSAGWQYYSQIPLHRKAMLCQSNTYDLQYYALSSLYLLGTSMPHASLNMLSIGLRSAWERGVHRRRGPDQKPSVESELQKRAFWALVSFDRIGSGIAGRPCGFPEEAWVYNLKEVSRDLIFMDRFDADYPIECDDEYWEPEDPRKAFQQPEGKPCTITAFVHFIKLCEILGFALRTLYINKKSKLLSGFIGNEWERAMVAELDSSMNKWKDSLPDYLRWDPNGRDTIFFKQAVNLQTTFSYVQIQIHRSFLIKKSSLSFASLAMCTNAARSCTHILETAMKRGLCVLPNTMVAAFTAGTIIALGIWGAHRSGFIGDPSKELEMFQRCIDVLNECEKRWNWAGRLADILNDAASINEYHAMATKSSSHEQFTPQRPSTETFRLQAPVDTPGMSLASTSGFDGEQPPFFMNDQDLYRLLLTEMGYLQRGDSRDMVGTSEGNACPMQDTTSNNTAVSQSSEFRPENETYMWWSDFPAFFNSSDEWETYLATMEQSHNF